MNVANTLLKSRIPSHALSLTRVALTRSALPQLPVASTRFPPFARAMSDIKTGAVLDASELQDGQMKMVDFEGGQVLLSKVNGEVVSVLVIPPLTRS